MFELHEIYYRITYPDRSRCYPGIESFVFIGKNLSDEDKEETWYFQPSRSFEKSGSVLESNQGDRAVACVTEKDKNSMLSLIELMAELEAASNRRKEKRSEI